MKRSFLALFAGTALTLLALAPFVHAQGFIIQEEVVGPNVKYMSGGVGLEERNAMESQSAKGYDLKLVFAITPGNYLSDIEVKINDQAGKPVISAQSNGPWFYADLPKGNYTVVATSDGVRKTHKVTVNGGLQRVAFHWKPEQPSQAAGKMEPKAGAAERRQAREAAPPLQPGPTGKTK